jgi:hypothetical protein
VIVVLQDGRITAFGGLKPLAVSLKSLADMASQGGHDRQRAVELLRQTLRSAQAPAAHAEVRKSLAQLGVRVGQQAARNGCVNQWHLLGTVPWDDAEYPIDRTLVGEPDDVDPTRPCHVGQRTLEWNGYVTGDSLGMVDLVRIFGPEVNVAAYGYAEVRLPKDQDLVLRVGSNDGFKCWFNGQEVGRFDGGRGYTPEQDRLPVRAHKGVNTILMKVTQQGAAWSFSVRLTNPAGGPIDLTRGL